MEHHSDYCTSYKITFGVGQLDQLKTTSRRCDHLHMVTMLWPVTRMTSHPQCGFQWNHSTQLEEQYDRSTSNKMLQLSDFSEIILPMNLQSAE